MVANGVPNKGTATKVKVSAKYVGREAVVITTPSQDRTGDLQRVRLSSWPLDHGCLQKLRRELHPWQARLCGWSM